MKKSLIVAAVAALAMVSCKKDYTCKCTITDNGTEIYNQTFTAKMKKSESENWCTGNSVDVNGLKSQCKLQ